MPPPKLRQKLLPPLLDGMGGAAGRGAAVAPGMGAPGDVGVVGLGVLGAT
jgi:hypothetical protein